MQFPVNAAITANAAAKLLITNEIDLSVSWPCEQSVNVLKALLKIPIEEILGAIDNTDDRLLDATSIPQFGNVETLIKVPLLINNAGIQYLNYAQMGFLLKNDLSASLDANTKFGENHGKGAALIGIANCVNKRITYSALSKGFCSITDPKIQEDIVIRLYFRIPVVQEILKHAANGKYNGFESMTLLMESTKKRRSQCLRRIFDSMRNLDNTPLNNRLDNIVWDIE